MDTFDPLACGPLQIFYYKDSKKYTQQAGHPVTKTVPRGRFPNNGNALVS